MDSGTTERERRPTYRDAHLAIDFATRTVRLECKTLNLTAKEYDLLAFLAEHAGEVLSRGSLLSKIWGYNDQTRTRTLDVHLARIRRKLGALGCRYIETIFGAGCRFQPQAGRSAEPQSGTCFDGAELRGSDKIELRAQCKPFWS